MSLRARLLLLVALATLLPAILLGLRFHQVRVEAIDQALAGLARQAKAIARDLDEKVQGTVQLTFGLSQAVALAGGDRTACSAFLAAVLKQNQQYTSLLTVTPDGKLFCDSLRTGRDLNLGDRPYFRNAVSAEDGVSLYPAIGRLTGLPVLHIAIPARSASNDLRFVLLASLNLPQFAGNLRRATGVDILLVDRKGTVLVAPDDPEWPAPVGTSIAGSELFRFASGAESAKPRLVAASEGDSRYWVAVDTPGGRDTGIHVMAGKSRHGLIAAVENEFYQGLIIVVALVMLLFAIFMALAELAVRRQIGRIATMAKHLGAGDLSMRISPPYPAGELGGLMRELNAAADSLERQHAAIDELNRRLVRAQQTEADTKTFLDTVIEHIPNAISVKVGPGGTHDAGAWQLARVNKAYETLAGFPREVLLGKTARDLYNAEAAATIAAADARALNSTTPVTVREFPLVIDESASRFVSSKRVAIRDDYGEPQYLLTVLEDVTERRRAEKRIAHMAHHDALTGLPNRAAFNGHFAASIESAKAEAGQFTVLSIDLNRFKETNDVYGHAVGDALLQTAARRLQDAAGGAFIARIGGDEFVMIATDGSQPAAAAVIADSLLAAFVEDFLIEGKRIHIGLSIGGAVYPVDGEDSKTLMVNADAALYSAKAEPRPAVVFFEPEMGAQRQARQDLQQDLRLAIERGEMLLHYQPQFRTSGEVVGFEALARWLSPVRGMVPPATFIPVAEEYSLIVPLGEWALREACREAATWREPLTIAVNVSPIQFHYGDLVSTVHAILLETGLAPARLVLEITEGVLINDLSRAVSILSQLKTLGVQIALDDFGKGYSSLSYLHAFAFDKIKIDRAFVMGLPQNRHSMAIVRAVIGLGQSLKVPVLAEGVETERQRSLLAREGCDEVQGYLTGRPQPMAHYRDLVSRTVGDGPKKMELAS